MSLFPGGQSLHHLLQVLEGSCDWNEEEGTKEEERFMSYIAVYPLANQILSLPPIAMSDRLRTLDTWELGSVTLSG